MNKEEFIKNWLYNLDDKEDAIKMMADLDKVIAAAPPQQTVSAEIKGEILARHFKELNELAKPFYQCLNQVGAAMEEYRNQPIKFIPKRTAKEEAENMRLVFGYAISVHILKYTITALKSRGIDTSHEEEVLTILKGM
jgi:hypothetical protein